VETLPIKNRNSSTITEGEEFWKRHSELQKSSGLSRIEYCREHKLNYHRFGYWLKRSLFLGSCVQRLTGQASRIAYFACAQAP